VRFLRRGSVDEANDPAPAGTGNDSEHGTEGAAGRVVPRGRTESKGRPTPKRRDAEGRRRGPVPPPPKTQRESAKLARQNRASRAERRKEAASRRSRMMAGDQGALLPRDRGPVKAFARDMIDSRRHLMGFFMPLAGLVFVSLVLPIPQIQQIFSYCCMAVMLAMAMEGVLLGRQVAKKARERFPKEKISGPGLGWYSFARASQLRRLRVPKPRVEIGETV
jgi:hypothetical protein